MDAVSTERLRKSYQSCRVLHGIDLRVPAGSLYGFLGPNGAGKTTTIRILLGLLHASGGRVTVLGRDPWRDGASLRADIGYLPGELRLYDRLTGRATLAFFDAARRRDSREEISRLADALDLDLTKRVRYYSRGMKQKLGLMVALAHHPQLLILDEPSMSLDPLVREVLLAELRRAASEGRTVLFSSHSLSEVEQLCDWVAIVREGRLVEQSRIESLRVKALRRVEVVFGEHRADGPVPDGFRVLRRSESGIVGSWPGPVEPLLSWLAGQQVQDVTISPPDLEDLFLAYYSDKAVEDRA